MKLRVVLYAVGLLVFCGCSQPPPPAAEAETPPAVVQIATVSRGAMKVSVEITGTYVAAEGTTARLSAATAGRWRSIDVREGDVVRKGQLLATVDTTVQAAGTTAAQAAANVAATQADQTRLGTMAASGDLTASQEEARSALTQAILERADAISDAKNAAQAAEAEFVRVNAGARPQEIALAEQAVVQADVSLSRAKAELERVRALSAEGYASRRQLEEAEATLALAQSAMQSAKTQLSLLQAGARPEERRLAQLALEKAKKAMASAVRLGDARVEQARATVARVESGRVGLQAKLAETRAAMQTVAQRQAEARAAALTQALGTVVAPFDGRVARRTANPGDVADPAVPILEVVVDGATDDFVGNVSPSVASRLSVGMQGQGSGFKGWVASVGQVDRTSGFVAVRLRGTRKVRARDGEFGSVTVTINRIADAVRVPKAAVIERNGRQDCFVVVDGKAVRRTIETSFADGSAVRVVSGLRPGEKVVVLGQYEIEDGAAVTPAKESP